MPNPNRFEARDRAMLETIDAAFERVREAYPGALPCGRGCSRCCVAFFEVTSLDLWRLARGLERLEPPVRAAVLERARAVVARAQAALPDWQPPFDVRDIGDDAFIALAESAPVSCPALGEQGECLVYADRPRICHLQGLSFVDPSGGAELPDFCASIFGDPAYSAIPPQPLPLFDQWEQEEALRREVSSQLPIELGGRFRTFVAAALCLVKEP